MTGGLCMPPRAQSLPAHTCHPTSSLHDQLTIYCDRDGVTVSSADPVASLPIEAANKQPSQGDGYNPTRAQSYDPYALLNPKASSKRRATDDSTQNGNEVGSKSSSLGSMIERMHNLQSRADVRPIPKKLKAETSDEDESKKSEFSGPISKGTELGRYIKDLRKDTASTEVDVTAANDVVDLTEDGDDDVIFISDSGDKEACLGRIEGATINAYKIPSPKPGSWNRNDSFWPGIKIDFRRLDNLRLRALDAAHADFGMLDPKTARALVPIINATITNSIRLSARISERPRKENEFPGSMVSLSLPLDLTLYCPKSMAVDIAKHLSKQSVWLRRPNIIDKKGIEYFNPQDVKTGAPKAVVSTTSRPGYVVRTVEEVRTDVLNMFDAIGHWNELNEEEQDEKIITPLLTHQKQALFFMTAREADGRLDFDEKSLWKAKQRGNGQTFYYHVITGAESSTRPNSARGGILADMMGLGKTLSVLSLIVGSLNEAAEFATKSPPRSHIRNQHMLVRNAKATLLICPLSVVSNWEEQITTHIQANTFSYYVYHGPNRIKDMRELAKFDLVITSYGTVRTDFANTRMRQKPIEQMNWFRIVLDEAHQIRDPHTSQSKAVCALSGQRRWAVTGTPVQNRLDDLGALLKFLRIEPFDSTHQFQQHIIAPFKTGDTEILPKLRLLVDHITLRRLKDRIDLPPRLEKIVKLDFSSDEEEVYSYFTKIAQQRANAYIRQKSNSIIAGKDYIQVLRLVTILRLLCAHGKDLLNEDDKRLIEGTSSKNAIELDDDDSEVDPLRPALTYNQAYSVLREMRLNDSYECDRCKRSLQEPSNADDADDNDPKLDTIGHMLPCFSVICPDCIDAFNKDVAGQIKDHHIRCPFCLHYVRCVFFELKQSDIDADEAARTRAKNNPRRQRMLDEYTHPHTKTKALVTALLENQNASAMMPSEPPIKSVVFSAWTNHLDLIEIALKDNGLKFVRLDGSMSRSKRGAALSVFREDPTVEVFLVSIYAGGLGLNLTSACKVYVMEPQFNPAAEAQAVDRVHRLGQTREVEVVRFIMNQSVEERVLSIQKKKRDLADLSMNRNLRLDKEEERKRKLEDLRDLFR